MPVEVRGPSDEILDAIVSALESYQVDHPDARIATYRQGPFSVRARIVDPCFARMKRSERHDLVWNYLERLSEDEQGDVHQLVLLAPDEVEKSLGNFEFENPSPPLSLNSAAVD